MLYKFLKDIAVSGNVLDVGCGSGILGFLLKRDFPNINLTLIDIQEVNYDLCLKNALLNGYECDIFCHNFLQFDFDKKFDFIVSNPPFYRNNTSISQNSHKAISKSSKFLELEEFIKKTNSILKPRGSLIFCYDVACLQDVFCTLKKYKLNVEITQFIHTNFDKNSNLVIILAKKSSKSLCKIYPPINIFNQNDTISRFALDIESLDLED